MKNLFLVLEGSDGTGKSSQRILLEDFFKSNGHQVTSIHFPRVAVPPYGTMVAEFLRGEYGSVASVHPKLAALIYALDRKQAIPELQQWLAEGNVLIADRYIFSNIAYQCAKLESPAQREQLSAWIERLEYEQHGIPRPDLTLYLDVPPEFSTANLQSKRSGTDRDYLHGSQDIHESSIDLQNKVRQEFTHLAQLRPGEIALVDCRGEDGSMADRTTIHNRIVHTLQNYGILDK